MIDVDPPSDSWAGWPRCSCFASNAAARALCEDRRHSAESRRCCPEGGATASDRPDFASMPRLRAARALAACRVRGDQPGRARRSAAVRGRAGALRGRSRRRGRINSTISSAACGGARGPAADLFARGFPDERLGGRGRPPAEPSVGARTGRGRRHPRSGNAGPGIADAGTGLHYASPKAHGEACRRAVEHDPPPAVVVSMAGIPLHRGLACRRAACTSRSAGRRCTRSPTRPACPRLGLSSRAIGPHRRRSSGEPGAWPRRASGSGCSRCAPWSLRRVAGSSQRSRPRPLRAPRGAGSMWR